MTGRQRQRVARGGVGTGRRSPRCVGRSAWPMRSGRRWRSCPHTRSGDLAGSGCQAGRYRYDLDMSTLR